MSFSTSPSSGHFIRLAWLTLTQPMTSLLLLLPRVLLFCESNAHQCHFWRSLSLSLFGTAPRHLTHKILPRASILIKPRYACLATPSRPPLSSFAPAISVKRCCQNCHRLCEKAVPLTPASLANAPTRPVTRCQRTNLIATCSCLGRDSRETYRGCLHCRRGRSQCRSGRA